MTTIRRHFPKQALIPGASKVPQNACENGGHHHPVAMTKVFPPGQFGIARFDGNQRFLLVCIIGFLTASFSAKARMGAVAAAKTRRWPTSFISVELLSFLGRRGLLAPLDGTAAE
jgi:hypothetical protein